MKSFDQRMAEEARLIILQELKRQTSGRLPVRAFRDALELEGHTRSHDWVRTELRGLKELGVVKLVAIGDDPDHASIAELTERGEDHLARRIAVEGIKRPEFGTGR